MARWGKLGRRMFLIGSASVAGGLAVGYYVHSRPYVNPLKTRIGAGVATLNPYVVIDARGVTLITPRADMGQGAISVQAALLAEELDIDWADIRTDPGPPAPAYYNAALMAEGMPFAATNEGWLARAARGMGGEIGKFMGLQITGGSSTVPDSYERLREAGALARAMLIGAAAERLGVPAEELSTKDGAVIAPDGTPLPYPELAAAAGRRPAPHGVRPKDPFEWRYLGHPMERLDIVAKSTGTQRYGIDETLPGMLYATVRMNPGRGGGVARVDTSAAEKMRGVVRVVTLPGGVAVIADNTWRAFQAARAVEIEWEPAPYPPTTEALFASIENAFSDETHDSRLKDEGSIEAALMSGATVAAEYRLPFLAHAPLEPMTALAWIRDGKLEIRAGTQIPLFALKRAADMLGFPEDDVILRALPMGGSFGRRLDDDYIAQAVHVAKSAWGRPVKLTWSREEDMAHDFPRPAAIARGRGRVEVGRVAALDLAIAAPSVLRAQAGRQGLSMMGAPDPDLVAGAWDQPFAIPDYRVTGYRAPATVPVGPWRSVGASIGGFAHECLMDELIHEAGADPLEERLRLCAHAPSTAVLEAVGEISGWGTPLAPGRGRGLAFTLSYGVPCAEVVEVSATEYGIRVEHAFAVADVGKVLDPVNIENQMQGGVAWGLGHAMRAQRTYEGGAPVELNFDAYRSLRIADCPEIVVRALEGGGEIRGIGEPTVPPAAPALANAIFAATGQRIRELPLGNSVSFV